MNEQALRDRLREGVTPRVLADEIDRHFDAMLYQCMPIKTAQRIEQERDRAHGVLAGAVFAAAVQR